ncbi:MAG: 3'-5' exonuclease [Candidatus Omnitrophica bacterium]|nr:3'-5' exonuclease [Candidatus Omnitrophota bacterium]MDD5430309.1 3'-5' exonuclease [Candidatus Omnitrophota bacterium]
MDLKKNIEEYTLVFLDLETTGLDFVMGDAICEIGAVKMEKRRTIQTFHSLVNPGKLMPKEAYQVHKISDEELKNAPAFKEIADNLIKFLKGSIICAYNAGFDVGFIKHYLKKNNYEAPDVPAVDILSMARGLLELTRYNLESVARYFNLDCSGGFHRAIDDSLFAAKIFYKLIDVFKQKGIETLEELVSLCGLDNDIFQAQENKKIGVLRQVIDSEGVIKARCFSCARRVEEALLKPLQVTQEKKGFYLCYQDKDSKVLRISLRQILNLHTEPSDA